MDLSKLVMIPIFVADRPASLRILEGLNDHKDGFGILAHAFTTSNFKVQFKNFRLATVKVGDSGIYQGKEISYEDLFSEYEKMGVTHGIIKDCYRNPRLTLESAKRAIKIHRKGMSKGLYSFELVGVAQGNTVAEYIESYIAQKKLGYNMVAIGGLLYKQENHKRMVRVKTKVFLKNVLTSIRRLYPEDALFPLGVFNKRRMNLFSELNVWGADYKGWIFRYDKEESDRLGNRFEQVRDYIKSNIFKDLDGHSNNALGNDGSNNLTSASNKRKTRLLILSCSKKKSEEPGNALNVYMGQAYTQIKKYYAQHNHLDVKIISAKYGLIDKRDVIEPYNNKMDLKSAKLYGIVFKQDFEALSQAYTDILVFGGKNYKRVVSNFDKFQFTNGKIGEQIHQLKEWLYKEEL